MSDEPNDRPDIWDTIKPLGEKRIAELIQEGRARENRKAKRQPRLEEMEGEE